MNKQKDKQVMVRTGQKGEYEVYTVMPSGVMDTLQEAEISTHYKKDTLSIMSNTDDIVTQTYHIDGKAYEVVLWGDDNLTPYHNMDLIEKSMIMSQCQNFNTLTCYSQGIRFLDRETKEMTQDAEIRRFCLRNAIHLAWMQMAIDMKYNFFSVMVIHLSRDHKRIEAVRMRQACDCRFTKRNGFGCIEHVIVGNWREGKQDVLEPIPLLDEIDPLGDLLYRMGREPSIYTSEKLIPPADGKDCKFAILCLMPTPGYSIYPIPPYFSIYRDYWYDIYRLIGLGKRYMIKNTSAPRIQIEVHRTYWDNVCREENITDKNKRAERIKKERQNITDFCTKPENAGKAWVTSYDTTPEGKEKRMVRVYNLMEGNKKEGGDWADDMQEAANIQCFTMGVHPNMIGATPGKSQMNNSGSDKRELFTLKQALEKAFHDIMEVPFHVIMHFNGWDERFSLDVPMIELTTLDQNKSYQESTVNTPEDGNNSDQNK